MLGLLWIFLQLVGIALVGYVAINTAKSLFARFPFGDKSSGWRWTKWVPLFGFGIMLMGFGAHIAVFTVGVVLIGASIAWAAYLSKERRM